jgi:hypothetical protein
MMDDMQLLQVVTPTVDEKKQALTEKVQAVLTSLENYENTTHDLFVKLETVIQHLPERTALSTLLSSDVLEKIDVIFLKSCETGPRKSIQKLEKGPWKMKPYQFIEHWGYAMREKPLFLRKLVKLSALMSSLTDSVAAIRAQCPDASTEIPKNGKRKSWNARHIDKVISTFSSEGTRECRRVQARRNKTSTPVILMGTPKSIANELQDRSPSVSFEAVLTSPPHSDNGRGAICDNAIEISDEESGGPSSHSTNAYEGALRQKSIESLQSSNWLIEDVFDTVLPVFTSHDRRTLVLNAGIIDVDNPTSNYGKIRTLKKSHELILIPLNIGKSHWIFALLSLTKQKASGLIYDPLHSKYNIAKAKTALEGFVGDGDRFGRSTDWTFAKHPVSSLISLSSLTFGRTDT